MTYTPIWKPPWHMLRTICSNRTKPLWFPLSQEHMSRRSTCPGAYVSAELMSRSLCPGAYVHKDFLMFSWLKPFTFDTIPKHVVSYNYIFLYFFMHKIYTFLTFLWLKPFTLDTIPKQVVSYNYIFLYFFKIYTFLTFLQLKPYFFIDFFTFSDVFMVKAIYYRHYTQTSCFI